MRMRCNAITVCKAVIFRRGRCSCSRPRWRILLCLRSGWQRQRVMLCRHNTEMSPRRTMTMKCCARRDHRLVRLESSTTASDFAGEFSAGVHMMNGVLPSARGAQSGADQTPGCRSAGYCCDVHCVVSGWFAAQCNVMGDLCPRLARLLDLPLTMTHCLRARSCRAAGLNLRCDGRSLPGQFPGCAEQVPRNNRCPAIKKLNTATYAALCSAAPARGGCAHDLSVHDPTGVAHGTRVSVCPTDCSGHSSCEPATADFSFLVPVPKDGSGNGYSVELGGDACR